MIGENLNIYDVFLLKFKLKHSTILIMYSINVHKQLIPMQWMPKKI